jgi:hypothetical protein
MAYRVEIARNAEAELEELYLWVTARAPQQGATWFNGLEQAVLSVDEHQPWIAPLSPHTLHCQSIAPDAWFSVAMISPRHRFRPGLRRHGTFVCQSPSGRWSVTHATIDPKNRTRFRRRDGRSCGRSPVSSSR